MTVAPMNKSAVVAAIKSGAQAQALKTFKAVAIAHMARFYEVNKAITWSTRENLLYGEFNTLRSFTISAKAWRSDWRVPAPDQTLAPRKYIQRGKSVACHIHACRVGAQSTDLSMNNVHIPTPQKSPNEQRLCLSLGALCIPSQLPHFGTEVFHKYIDGWVENPVSVANLLGSMGSVKVSSNWCAASCARTTVL
ncbi:hypothetical protein BJV74DRAFT_851811 [Russula compacta]|nr:hypothetical protein BJV74DRAFT_851811 [Russula compacta]